MLQGSAYIHIEEDVSMEDFQFSSPQKLYKKEHFTRTIVLSMHIVQLYALTCEAGITLYGVMHA